MKAIRHPVCGNRASNRASNRAGNRTSNRTSSQATARARQLLLCCLACLLPAAATAATDADRDAVREQLSRDWYYTEVIIFHRPAVLDFLSEEALAGTPEAGFPGTVTSFVLPPDPGDGSTGLLRRDDPACLAFPNMDARDLAATEAAARARADARAAQPERPATPAESTQPAPAPAPQLASDPLLDYLNSVAEYEAALEARSLVPLSPDDLTLGSEAARIDGDRRFQVLWHGGWLQAVPAREAPLPLLIQSGHRWEEVYQLEGAIDVTLGRYLHFRTRLFYHEPLLGEAPADQPVPPEDAAGQPLTEPADAGGEPADAGAPAGTLPAALASALAPDAPRFMMLEESRRMRSSELHYLDHPKMGVLVRIDPVEVPESLVEAYLALEESPE